MAGLLGQNNKQAVRSLTKNPILVGWSRKSEVNALSRTTESVQSLRVVVTHSNSRGWWWGGKLCVVCYNVRPALSLQSLSHSLGCHVVRITVSLKPFSGTYKYTPLLKEHMFRYETKVLYIISRLLKIFNLLLT